MVPARPHEARDRRGREEERADNVPDAHHITRSKECEREGGRRIDSEWKGCSEIQTPPLKEDFDAGEEGQTGRKLHVLCTTPIL